MGRTSPPAAIVAPIAKSITSNEFKSSDLPLRNFASSLYDTLGSDGLHSSTPENTPGLSELETPNSLADDLVPTPSSTMVEFDDDGRKDDGQPAMIMAAKVSQAYLRSRSASGNSDTHSAGLTSTAYRSAGRKSRSTTRTPLSRTMVDESSSRATSRELVNRYLQGLPNIDPIKQLSLENTSLHQRIAGLQRVERDLLGENHALVSQMASTKRQNDLQRQKWRDDFRGREKAYKARIKALEERLALQDRELAQHAANRTREERQISDEEVKDWFTKRSCAWQAWVEDFVHRDPERIQSGIHPVQLLELCESVKSFVTLTDDGLPEELLAGDSATGVKAGHVLLHAMLANFLISEAIESPNWIFAALASSSNELESPSVINEDSMSPIGFRMDLAMWNNVAPPRSARFPPMSARILPDPPKSARQLPTMTITPSLSLNTTGLAGSSNQDNAPSRAVMETFFRLLSNVQRNETDVDEWRAQLMTILSEGGMSSDLGSVEGDERRFLQNCRKIYSRKLKERFLGGAARFLLQDQDATGIDRLESSLVEEIDAALQFSCRVWSRREPLRLKGLKELTKVPFLMSNETMQLCRGQAPSDAQQDEVGSDQPPAYHDGHTVVLVIQPVIEYVAGNPSGTPETSTVVSKARVLVAAPGPRSAYPKSDATPLTAKPIDGFSAFSALTPTPSLVPAPQAPASVAASILSIAAATLPAGAATSAFTIPVPVVEPPPSVPPKDISEILLGVAFVPPAKSHPEILPAAAYATRNM